MTGGVGGAMRHEPRQCSEATSPPLRARVLDTVHISKVLEGPACAVDRAARWHGGATHTLTHRQSHASVRHIAARNDTYTHTHSCIVAFTCLMRPGCNVRRGVRVEVGMPTLSVMPRGAAHSLTAGEKKIKMQATHPDAESASASRPPRTATLAFPDSSPLINSTRCLACACRDVPAGGGAGAPRRGRRHGPRASGRRG